MNLIRKDKQYLWHPFTQMQDWLKGDVLIIERGRGNYLYDARGRKYLDGISSLWCNIHGHRKNEIDRAIKKQLQRVAHSTMLGLSHPPAIELAEQLIKIAPRGLTRVFYSDDGSTAMEIALKMALQYWRQTDDRLLITDNRLSTSGYKEKFLTFTNAYHGDTVGSVSLGGIQLFHDIYKPLLFRTIQVPAPYCYRCPYDYKIKSVKFLKEVHPQFWVDRRAKARAFAHPHLLKEICGLVCLEQIERVMKKRHQELAAVVIEPLIQGAAGMITQPSGFLKRIRQLCSKYNILMIADEVATGFGRTGKMFACSHKKVTPDIMALAKGITGGYLPLAATLATEKIFNAFLGTSESKKTFFHGHTYTGNPLACAAALANLKIFKKEKVLQKLQVKIEFLKHHLQKFYELEHVGDIRQCGFMVGIELVKNKTTKEPYPYKIGLGHRVILEARKRGVILRPLGDVIVLMPPLSITESQLQRLLKVTYQAIWTVTKILK
ncbi:MAG: aspartate aminotransferase family protein [Planctomycetota bacterium]